MSTKLPQGGFTLQRIYTTHLELSHAEAPADASADAPPESAMSLMSFQAEWRKQSEDVFDVRLQLRIDPSRKRPERLVVHLVGNFKQVGTPALKMEQFASLNAVAILMPYVRQHMTAVTISSYYGPYYLPTINVSEVVKGLSPDTEKHGRQIQQRRPRPSAASTTKRRSVKAR